MDLPKGLVRVRGPGDTVGASLRTGLVVALGLGALLLVGVGIALLVVAPTGSAGAGNEVPLWAPLLLIVLGVLTGYLAWAARRPKYLITDEGFVSRAVFGKAMIRWDRTERISLSRPRGNALWFDAPGGIEHRGKVSRKTRISAALGGLEVQGHDLLCYSILRWHSARSASDGSSDSLR